MKKAVAIQRTLLLEIALTGDRERDLNALETYNFEGLDVMSLQKRDMVEKEHNPKIFYKGPKGVFSHSLEGKTLSIWQEFFTVEDC